ncbi:hypothetical protein CLV58_1244 [Spirosoma oryzae]|uniref:Uncharacterized protein n=1 Tax=Spirosoma oryzae TaxID=1469603 RepID=A0A2T0SAP3_9BACT|nr:hypothetical protein [Spirosoma oryzae]PRY30383.1 hypothetical protein CLV58_1244 [Spirosoma oryzae]
MSYLNGLRLHFSGRFQAAPSTVNNDVTHFNNSTFLPNYQQYGRGATNGWWNPGGGAEWRLLGCTVQTAWLDADTPTDASDVVLGCIVGDTDRRAPAKIVDLDPLQQLVSEIWGLEVRLSTADGQLLLRGQYDATGFMDIWDRAQGGGGDVGAGSMYQSVLTELEWGDLSRSPFLEALQQASPDKLLSIKFNVDGYNMDRTSPEFTRGRIVGTIGPATNEEPRHFVAGRQFIPQDTGKGNFFAPQASLGFCVARLDESARRLFLDLGNALPTTVPGGPLSDLGLLQLLLEDTGEPISSALPYLTPNWYEQTAGLVAVPAQRPLTDAEIEAINTRPLALQLLLDGATQLTPESPNGLFVRADRFVFRADAGQSVAVDLWATRYGQPYANATILLQLDASQLQPGSGYVQPVTPDSQPSTPGEPTDVLSFPNQVTADQRGRVTVCIQAGDPQRYRQYIDGQVYGLRPSLAEIGFPPLNPNPPFIYPLGTWNFISFLIWDAFPIETPVTWYGCLQPIFQQYANLYPVMSRFLNLADPLEVWANQALLTMAFGLPITDPNTMPVTRDLSMAKRQAILAWLNATDTTGQPLLQLGEPWQRPLPPAAASALAVEQPTSAASQPAEALRGGKAMAASRRLVLR